MYKYIKAIFDRVYAIISTIIAFPVLLILVFLQLILNPGPVFVKNIRIGKNRKAFTIYKFRTMAKDITEIQKRINKNEGSHNFDPRLTPFGSFLRTTNLSELPLLFSIIKGDLSVIGPRPFSGYEIEKYNTIGNNNRFLVKPGIVSPAYFYFSYEDYASIWKYEDAYIDKMSLLFDSKIYIKSILNAFNVNKK